MNKLNKPVKDKATKPKPNASNSQRGFGVIELLFAASTLGAAVLVAAMNSSKKPPLYAD